jgi:hypothetical protein
LKLLRSVGLISVRFMPEPVSTITTLHGLVTRLVEIIKDRKFAAEMREVQRMVAALDAEHFELKNEQLQLVTENMQLKQLVAALEQAVAGAEKQNTDTDEIRFHKTIKFVRETDRKSVDAALPGVRQATEGNKANEQRLGCYLFCTVRLSTGTAGSAIRRGCKGVARLIGFAF